MLAHKILLVAGLCLCLLPLTLNAQGANSNVNTQPESVISSEQMTKSYQRAAQVQRYMVDRWVINANLYPRWIDGQDIFWYKQANQAGHNYQVVDANNKKSWQLLDNKRLAEQLQQQSGEYVNADELPLSGMKISLADQTIDFSAFKKRWLYQLDNKQLTEVKDYPYQSKYLVSPDGNKLVYLKDHNLWLKDLGAEKEQQLTFDGEKYNSYGTLPDAFLRPVPAPLGLWSPDSKTLFIAQTDDRQVKEFPLIRYAPSDGSIRPQAFSARTALPGDKHVTQFRMLAINTETSKEIPAHYPTIPAVRMNDTPFSGMRTWWSADSRHAFFVDVARGEKTAKVVEFDSHTGETRVLFTEKSDTYIDLGPNVYSPAAFMPLEQTNELIWYSERSGYAHLYLYDMKTGKLKKSITSGDWQVRDLIHVNEVTREVIIALAEKDKSKNPYHRQIAKVNIDSGKLTLLSDNNSDSVVHHPRSSQVVNLTYRGIDISTISGVSPSGKYFVETSSRADSKAETVLRDHKGKPVLTVETADDSNMPEFFNYAEPVKLTASDGKTDIRGLIFRPSNFDPSKKYPVIDNIYGGPQVSNVPESFSGYAYINSASLAELGFIVVVIDGRGTADRSKLFRDESYGKAHTASNLEDHIAGIKQLAKRYPYMDITRVGIYGFSGGGYMTANAVLRFPEFFKVGVAWAGNHDQRLFWHTWGERYQGLVEGDNYLPQANPTYAKNMQGKLFLIHGMIDHGVHPAGVFQLTQALMDNNKDFDMLMLPRSGHALPGYGMRRKWDYFVEHLSGKTPAKNFKLLSVQDNSVEKSKQKKKKADEYKTKLAEIKTASDAE